MSRSVAAGAILAVSIAFLGCSHEPILVTVTGDVTYGGERVGIGGRDALIRFEPADPSAGGRPADVPVVNGRYTAMVIPGNYTVSVTWVKHKKGDHLMNSGTDSPEIQPEDLIELIPEQYNRKTTLTAEVSQEKAVHDFNLKAEKK